MKKNLFAIVLLLVISGNPFICLQIGIVKAQFQTIGFPSDYISTEPSTIVVPDDFVSISDAISYAQEGDTIFIRKGTYDGPINQTLFITKAISIVGESSENTVINLHSSYTVTWITMQAWYDFSNAIEITANNVKLENLTFAPKLGGLIRVAGNGTQIINCILTKGIFLASWNNYIINNKVAREFRLNNSSLNIIAGNTVLNRYISLYLSNSNVFHNNTCRGVAVNGSNNVFSHNIMNGRNYADPIVIGVRIYGANNIFHDNYIMNYSLLPTLNEGKGATLSSSALNNTFYRNTFVNNAYNARSGLSGNFWDNNLEGNYWSDYNGTDRNGDGIGDTPYIINENNQDNYPLMAPIKSFDVGTFDGVHYQIDIASNSLIHNFYCNPDLEPSLSFYVHGGSGKTEFCRVTIPKDLLTAQKNNWIVLVNDVSVIPTINEDAKNTFLNFTYNHNTETVKIIGTEAIPEFHSWIILVLFLISSLSIAVMKKLWM